MAYINNYREPIELAQGATTASLSLPDGEYRLTLTNSASAAWEIVDAVVASGSATLTRAVEGTSDQSWPTGSTIYCAVTAGQLNAMANPGESGVIVSNGPPTETPPAVGAIHVSTLATLERACVAVGTRGPEDWLPLSVLPPLNGYEATSAESSYSIERSAKEISVYSPYQQTGAFSVVLTMPAWEASPLGFSLLIEPQPSASVVTKLDLSALLPPGRALVGEAQDFGSGATLDLVGTVLSITTSERVIVSRLILEYGETEVWFSLEIRPAAALPAFIPLG
ncbi:MULTISPECIES: hypothetical protein [Stutzerimonas stutzeri subgroup]|uniref:Uncharacterized protein n=1 Tax=Stutzerimonas stutzeri CCUG 29243 TaxID=1196835 RepID=I4CRD2_STUST|nr:MULTISPECIES: hypothetical protein [Stutzerimonas stutzeri subgroup]AFM32639.1 hypothetical protein A458_06965 [Stutzerimonas stutzeri CCUG 29243]MCQ2040264.1 hypothetical protein [Stutzerimonas kunmingensis]QSH74591.1 hypothetical protein pAN_17 [Pseudomonas phage vB_PstS-pAN]